MMGLNENQYIFLRNEFETIGLFTGYTPAHIAAQQEDLVAMKLLVHGKADINMADGKSGKTPLHHVVEVDELSIAAYLILQVINP